MDNQRDVDHAWRFVLGFDVPVLTDGKRIEWEALIRAITMDDFQKAARAARNRPSEQLHLRPSIEAFKGYAGFGVVQRDRYGDWTPEHYSRPSDSERERVAAIISKARECIGPTKKKNEGAAQVTQPSDEAIEGAA